MWTINENKEWEILRRFGWVSDMRGVLQSPIHHAEGDVETHTKMVLQELENLPEYQALSLQDQQIVWAAALLHDVEKRSTTITDDDGKIVSPGHAKKGALTTRNILYREIKTPFQIREEIVGLVRHHGLPIWIFDKPDPVKSLLKASLEVNTHLLAILAKADILGRICQDQSEMIYRIDMFVELCKENECLGNKKGFPSELARFSYFRKTEQTPDYEPFNDLTSEAIILSGIAGSGKDHFIKSNYPDHLVISLDEMRRAQKISHRDTQGNGRIIQAAKELARECLRKHIPFIWNGTNITLQMRDQLVDLFEVYNPYIRIIYLEVDYHKLHSQNMNREFPIPKNAIEKMIDKLEVPKLWEAHEVKYVVVD